MESVNDRLSKPLDALISENKKNRNDFSKGKVIKGNNNREGRGSGNSRISFDNNRSSFNDSEQ